MAFTRGIGLIALAVAGWLLQPSLAAAGDDALARAKDLYLSASYDEALTVLEQVPRESLADSLEAAEYRVFCLVALNRRVEAQQAIEALVRMNPSYKPSEDEASPRIRLIFLEVRQRLLTAIVQSAYADAKAAFDRRDPQAAAMFEHVLDLVADPDLAPAMSDLRTVALGFRDLSWAAGGTSSSRAAGEGGSAPSFVPELSQSTAPGPADQFEGGAGSRPVAARTVSTALSSEPDSGVVPPEVIFQPMPTWTPSAIESTRVYKGSLELAIDEQGNVVTARMRRPAHPRYDELLVKAAQTWRFKPARRGGVTIPYLRVVEIELRPYQ